MAQLSEALVHPPGTKFHLNDFDAEETYGVDKAQGVAGLEKNVERLAVLQYLLYAEAKRSVLIVLQGIDAAGKDGVIRHVMAGMNPQGVSVTPFKVPEGEEKRHDYLWRIHKAVPEWGQIGIFNRSHYEEVLVVRVHNLVPKSDWEKRYSQINDFEQMLTENKVTVLKFLLMISKDEQAKRFHERIEDKTKNWKFNEGDIKEREYWDSYMDAYDDVIEKCSTRHAPWHVIPSNRKWFRNYAVSEVICSAMEKMGMEYPKAATDLSKIEFE